MRFRPVPRRAVVVVLALASLIGLSACGSKQDTISAAAAKPFTVVLDFFPNADHAALYSAIAHGDFRAVGLDVQPQTPSDPSAPLKLLAAGKADMAISYEPELLIARGEPVENRTITTLIPVSLRTSDARGMLDNRVSAVYARLPVGIADPIDLLSAVRAHMDTLKRSHEIEASAAIVGIGDFAPPVVAAVLARAVVHSQEIVQTVATNVPGPQFPLYVCGRRMREAYPYVPIAGHIRVGVAIWSYCGEVYFGITGDWDGAPDIEKLAAGIDLAFDDMRGAATGAAV